MSELLIDGFDWALAFVTSSFSLQIRLAPIYLASFAGIAYLVWLWQHRPGKFLGWLFPKNVYFHRSHRVDIQLFIVGRLLSLTGFFGSVFFPAIIASYVLAVLVVTVSGSYEPPPISVGRSLIVTLIIVVSTDFCVYWIHRVHHEAAALWPFHALHHSAEVLTPVTVYRKHPVYDLIAILVRSLLVGLVQGIVLFSLIGSLDIVTIGGANAFYVVFNLLGSNLRHSHIWLSYGPVLERIFISPAQHQIHHSCAVEHINKNYGEIFAIWDWIFGTLFIPTRRETLTFGLSDGAGRRIEQPHPTLAKAIIQPFQESGRVLGARFSRALAAVTETKVSRSGARAKSSRLR